MIDQVYRCIRLGWKDRTRTWNKGPTHDARNLKVWDVNISLPQLHLPASKLSDAVHARSSTSQHLEILWNSLIGWNAGVTILLNFLSQKGWLDTRFFSDWADQQDIRHFGTSKPILSLCLKGTCDRRSEHIWKFSMLPNDTVQASS